MQDISKKNKKEKPSLILILVSFLPFIACAGFIYLWVTTTKTLWEGKIFFIVATFLTGLFSFGLLLSLILKPFYAKIDRELEEFGRLEKAKVVKVKLANFNFISPKYKDRDKFEYNHEELCSTAMYYVVLEFTNRDGKKVRRTHDEIFTAAEATALAKKENVEVKVYKNYCKLVEEIPQVTYDKDILRLNSKEVKVSTGITILTAKATVILYSFLAIFTSLIVLFFIIAPFVLYAKFKLSSVFIMFLPAVMFLAITTIIAAKVFENIMVGSSNYRTTVYGFSLLARYRGRVKDSSFYESRYAYYVSFTANGKTYDKQIDARTFARLQIVQRVGIGFDVFVKGKKTLIDIDSLPIF